MRQSVARRLVRFGRIRQAGWLAACAAGVLLAMGISNARAQEQGDQGGGRARFAGMQRVGGTVTSVSGANLTIKGEDGATYQVVTTDNTRIMRGRGVTVKLSDLKAGDGVYAMGNLDAPNKTLHAAMVMSMDADQWAKVQEARKQELANLGRTNIIGRVTAVDLDNATMTVARPDGVTQTIGFDEGTSFKRGRLTTGVIGLGRGAGAAAGTGASQGNVAPAGSPAPTGESITLADVKVGDMVGGPGAVKDGKFVAKELTVMTPGAGRRREGEQSGASAGTAANASPQAAAQQPK
jgi:hypothetical protein